MTCPSCKQTYFERTVCPDCIKVLRPRALTIVALIYIVLGALDFLAGLANPVNIIGAIVTVIIGWYLLRVNALAIGLAMLRAVVGIVIALLVILAFRGSSAPNVSGEIGINSGDNVAVMVTYIVVLIANMAVAALLFSRGSRQAFDMLRRRNRDLELIIKQENEAAEPEEYKELQNQI